MNMAESSSKCQFLCKRCDYNVKWLNLLYFVAKPCMVFGRLGILLAYLNYEIFLFMIGLYSYNFIIWRVSVFVVAIFGSFKFQICWLVQFLQPNFSLGITLPCCFICLTIFFFVRRWLFWQHSISDYWFLVSMQCDPFHLFCCLSIDCLDCSHCLLSLALWQAFHVLSRWAKLRAHSSYSASVVMVLPSGIISSFLDHVQLLSSTILQTNDCSITKMYPVKIIKFWLLTGTVPRFSV